MSDQPEGEREWAAFLASHPAFKRRAYQFMVLYDAAQILGELQPPHGDAAAAFLRGVADHVMRDAGVPEEFVRVMADSRPPFDAARLERG